MFVGGGAGDRGRCRVFAIALDLPAHGASPLAHLPRAAVAAARNAGDDLLWGDSGLDVDRVTRVTTVVTSGKPGADDFAAAGDDTIDAGASRDIAFGDHGEITQVGGAANVLAPSGAVALAATTSHGVGGGDTITASGAGENLLFGGTGADRVTGGDDADVILGDIAGRQPRRRRRVGPRRRARHERRGRGFARGRRGQRPDPRPGRRRLDRRRRGQRRPHRRQRHRPPRRPRLLEHDLRFRFGLWTGALYDAAGNIPHGRTRPRRHVRRPARRRASPSRSSSTTPPRRPTTAGATTPAAGDAGNDVVFGQLGDDTLAGGTGDDYVEGNGGNDSIRGGIGQDDLVGGSSDRFGPRRPASCADGRNEIFGGDGSKTGRGKPATWQTAATPTTPTRSSATTATSRRSSTRPPGSSSPLTTTTTPAPRGSTRAWWNCSTTPRAWPARPTSAAPTASTARTATMASGHDRQRHAVRRRQ